MMKLVSAPLPGGESMSFFYVRLSAGLLLTPTYKYIVVAVLNNSDPAFGPARRRLSELRHWTGFQTRTFGEKDLPLVADEIVAYDCPTIASRDTPLSLIQIQAAALQAAPISNTFAPQKTVYDCSRHPNLRVTLVPVSDRVQLASKGNLRDALETFQCMLERV